MIRHKIKEENKILIMLAIYSISIGLWENFRQLWLQQNQFDISQISNLLSLATLLCAIAIVMLGKKLNIKNIKTFILSALLIKIINLIVLFSINGNPNFQIGIQISISIDIIIERLIIITIYPFICTIKKDNTLYSKRKLVEYLFKDIGILIGGILIGKIILGYLVDYNICLFISIVFLILAFGLLIRIRQQETQEEIAIDQKLNIISYIKQHKKLRIYLLYIIFGNIAMNIGLGLKMLMFTDLFQLSVNIATTYLLIIGLIADGIGILALKFFTPKNDYMTVFIKFGIRMLSYIVAFLSNNLIVCFLAITWSILISTAYENKIDGQFINEVPNIYQLAFNNIIFITQTIATAIGLFFAGIVYPLGVQFLLGLSAVFMFFQINFANTLIYMNKHKKIGD